MSSSSLESDIMGFGYTMNGIFKKPRFQYREDEPIWFTSDTHFNHANIIKFCNRPFKDIKEHDEVLIENWNNRVGKDDLVFHLGDFCFGGSYEWNKYLDALNGKIILIIGNHDRKNLRQGYITKFEFVTPQMQITIGKQSIYLNHMPFLCYAGSWRNVWQLFGHVHSGPNSNKDGIDIPRLEYLYPLQYDVGVDNNDFVPISYQEIKAKIDSQIEKSKK